VKDYTPPKPATDDGKQWEGWGTALKPAHEPIVMARKPFAGTVAANVMEYGTGALNIDATRIGRATDDVSVAGHRTATFGTQDTTSGGDGSGGWQQSAGRWTANMIFTHSPDCQQTGTITDTFTVVAGFRDYAQNSNFGARAQVTQKPQSVEVVTWDCVPGCPVAALNTQSGQSISRKGRPGDDVNSARTWGNYATQPPRPDAGHNDSGGASRFFTTTEWDPEYDVPFLYVAKPSRRERNAGLDGMPEQRRSTDYGSMRKRECNVCASRTNSKAGWPSCGHEDWRWVEQNADGHKGGNAANHHPTVKPVALMRHLVRLVTPPGGTVLDPFLGSGTTAVAATLEGFAWIGCELTDDYLPIIEARVAWANGQSPTTSAAPVEPSLTLFDGSNE
jgi:site-specific DNA-methyltransferase (adenine-specific)